jgi:hypothetical protein
MGLIMEEASPESPLEEREIVVIFEIGASYTDTYEA